MDHSDGSGYEDGNGYGYGNGDGYGYGSGYEDGNGYGYGHGNGNGSGYGDGNGYGNGDGNGDGNGYGYGDSNGNGYGSDYEDGNGNGYGNGKGFIAFRIHSDVNDLGDNKENHMINDTYYIVRSKAAGVFAGYIESRNTLSVVMVQARRLWYWSGASSLSQLAMDGPQRPDDCKFPCIVDRVEIFEVIEILDVTPVAEMAIKKVKIWKQ
jgi:hypothetical protein